MSMKNLGFSLWMIVLIVPCAVFDRAGIAILPLSGLILFCADAIYCAIKEVRDGTSKP
jgi:hypothetical protein